MRVTQVRDLTLNDADLIGSIIGRSFADDPVNQWVFRNTRAIIPHYQCMARKLYLKKGYGHVTADVSAGALWLPPGVSTDLPLWRSLDVLISMLRHGGPLALRNGFAIDALLGRHKPKEPHYYLYTIGTLPERQGQGLGSELLRTGLEAVDRAGMPAYLESSKYVNVPLYQRFGFEVTEKVSTAPDTPPLWLMWREARNGTV